MFNIDKKYTNILKNNFLVGFEIEFILLKQYNRKFLRDHLNKIQKGIIIGFDGSIEPNSKTNRFDEKEHDGVGYELKTVPVPSVEALKVLSEIFEFVNKYGYCNHSCGFHVNVSPISDENYENINPFYVSKHDLWKQIKKAFNRSNCTYCKNYDFRNFKEKLSLMEVWKAKRISPANHYNRGNHYQNINFDNYHLPRKKSSRIEIRAFGGNSYDKKFPLIVHYIDKSLEVINKGYGKWKKVELI